MFVMITPINMSIFIEMADEHRELRCWPGSEKLQSGLETLKIIQDGCNSPTPFYFIRFSDVDSHIVCDRIKGLQKTLRRERNWAARGLKAPPLEAADPNLQKEMTEVRRLYQQENVVMASHKNKLYPVGSNKAYNYYCFSSGLFYYEHFIPFLKNSFKNTLYLCDDNSNGNELISKMFDIKTFLTLPPSAYFSIDEQYNKVRKLVDGHDTVIGAVGFSTKIIAKRLYKDGINTNFIDTGSVVDIITGNPSRGLSVKIAKGAFTRSWEEIYYAYADAFGCNRDGLLKCYELILNKRQSNLIANAAHKVRQRALGLKV